MGEYAGAKERFYRVQDDVLELGDWVTGFLLGENIPNDADGEAFGRWLNGHKTSSRREALYTAAQIRGRIA